MSEPGSLPVVETFHSLQGEGHHSGRSAFFIRLGGCNVGCPWCDTKHSWPEQAHPSQAINALADQANDACHAGAAFTVITGGEPLQHDLHSLTELLHRRTARPVHLETSGVDPLSGQLDWITLSPKRHRPPRTDLLAACDELKVVVFEPEDLSFAEEMAKGVREDCQLLLQPGWDSSEGQALVMEQVRRQPHWRLSLQTHKWLGVR